MKRAEILKDLIKERGMKVADLVRVTGIPYSTIKSTLENGIEKTSYANVCKLCEALGITPDTLEDMASGLVVFLPDSQAKRGNSQEDSSDTENDSSSLPYEPTYEDIRSLVARNGKKLTLEQKQDIIRTLLSDD